MSTTTRMPLALRDCHPQREPLVADLLRGLRDTPKHVSPSYFYDARGSQLFDAICELPEYYVTRTERCILETHAVDIARCIGAQALLVEYGSGASIKTRILLDQLPHLSAYVPVEISRAHLLDAAHRLSETYPRLEVLPVCADFTLPFDLPKPHRPAARTVVFFPGSTLGNFDPPAAIDLMRLMRNLTGPNGGLVIGTDLVKNVGILLRAYNDAAGVTAEFNLNLLRRLNREFGADFDLAAFSHEAIWNAAESRIEMHLISARQQVVRLAGERIQFAPGERLVTEHSHKYTLDSFQSQAAEAGWDLKGTWLDDRRFFGVHYLDAGFRRHDHA